MITLVIIVITTIFSILCFNNKDLFFKHQFNPYIINERREWHRFFTHALVHADWIHLLFNMYVLYSFGNIVEYYYDNAFEEKSGFYYCVLYVGAVLASSIPAFEKHKHNSWYNAVGASGAVSAVVFASILFNPAAKIGIIFIPIGIPAFIFGFLYLGYSYYMAKKDQGNIAHDAHFFGALFGIMFTLILDRDIGKNFISIIKQYLD